MSNRVVEPLDGDSLAQAVTGVGPGPLLYGATLEDVHPVARRRLPVTFRLGAGFITLVVLAAIVAPLLPLPSPNEQNLLNHLLPPGSPGHLLGTDQEGRDILSRLIWGARVTLLAAVTPVVISAIIGTTLGMAASLSGRIVNSVIMRGLDIIFAFPPILLAIAITSALGPGIDNDVIALSVVFTVPIGRIVETEVKRVRSADFVEAARASGATTRQIAIRQLLPIVGSTLLVYCTLEVGLAIVFISGLSFLGLGQQPPNPEWGAMLADLQGNIFTHPTLVLIPAGMIFVTSCAVNLMGLGLRDYLDVRSDRIG